MSFIPNNRKRKYQLTYHAIDLVGQWVDLPSLPSNFSFSYFNFLQNYKKRSVTWKLQLIKFKTIVSEDYGWITRISFHSVKLKTNLIILPEMATITRQTNQVNRLDRNV